MKRKLGTIIALLLSAILAYYLSAGGLALPIGGKREPVWAEPSAAALTKMKAELGIKVSATELTRMKSATVSRVVDGDTVELQVGSQKLKVRLLNLDTPETVDPRRPVEAYGKEASAFTTSVLKPGTKVFYRYDVEKQDRYDRHLLHLYLADGTWYNALMVRAGYAQVATYPPNVSAAAFFRDLQRKARAESVGLWQIPEYQK